MSALNKKISLSEDFPSVELVTKVDVVPLSNVDVDLVQNPTTRQRTEVMILGIRKLIPPIFFHFSISLYKFITLCNPSGQANGAILSYQNVQYSPLIIII